MVAEVSRESAALQRSFFCLFVCLFVCFLSLGNPASEAPCGVGIYTSESHVRLFRWASRAAWLRFSLPINPRDAFLTFFPPFLWRNPEYHGLCTVWNMDASSMHTLYRLKLYFLGARMLRAYSFITVFFFSPSSLL